MLTKYTVTAIFEHEYNALLEELNVCLDAVERGETNGNERDAMHMIDKLTFATGIIARMYEEIKKL